MMTHRVAIRGRNLADLTEQLKQHDVEIVNQDPDLVISHGGDGALLGAEREFPGVPKCPIRDLRNNPPCPLHRGLDIVGLALHNKLTRFEVIKVEARTNGHVFTALNDISIHRKIPSSAVRFRLNLDHQLYANQIVGDGLVVATPFGSTGYYRSITHSIFRIGLGLAFNNTTEPIDHLVVEESCQIKVGILRGPAVVVADNDPNQIELRSGDCLEFRRTGHKAVILGLDILRCRDCFTLRQKMENPC